MLRDSASWFVVTILLMSSVCANETENISCNCDDDIVDAILDWQRLSDYIIALSYFAIPIELLYFLNRSKQHFKWILVEFVAFVALFGMTRLLNTWSYGPHRVPIFIALTVFKLLTGLMSCAVAITLMTLTPLFFKAKLREYMLSKKNWELERELGIIRRRSNAKWHVRKLTRAIRMSLDRHTILFTTMMELSKTLGLQNCAVWMPNEDTTEMILTHQLQERAAQTQGFNTGPIPCSDVDVRRVKETQEVVVLSNDSAIGFASSGGLGYPGAVAAICVTMMRAKDSEWDTPRLGILVLVAPNGKDGKWSLRERDLIHAVAEQVAIAVSHAAVLEDSRVTREKLAEQNRALKTAKKNVMRASKARERFQKAMSYRTRKPMHTISGLVSLLKEESLSCEQKLIVDTMMKASNVLTALVCDVMDGVPTENGRFLSEPRFFGLRSFIREAGCVVKCLCAYDGFGFAIEVDPCLPDHVVGDERGVLQVIMHMIRNLLKSNKGVGGGLLRFRAFSQRGMELGGDREWATRITYPSDDGCHVYVRFEVEIVTNGSPPVDELASSSLGYSQRDYRETDEGDSGLHVSQKPVEPMEGSIWVFSDKKGCPQSMVLVLQFGVKTSPRLPIVDLNERLKGLQVVLADEDGMNREVTLKMLEKLGCCVTAVSSGYDCLRALGPHPGLKVVVLDLNFDDLDGLKVAKRIRKVWKHNAPLIVALTASVDWEKMEEVGINEVIRKPVVLEDLAAQLQRALLEAIKEGAE